MSVSWADSDSSSARKCGGTTTSGVAMLVALEASQVDSASDMLIALFPVRSAIVVDVVLDSG